MGKTEPARTARQTSFAADDGVRVKRGVTDPDFPDITLEGWAGEVKEVDDSDEPIDDAPILRITALADPDETDADLGLLCREGLVEGRSADIPLSRIQAKKDSPARGLVADYNYWFWNCR